jgi:hypothetical protein
MKKIIPLLLVLVFALALTSVAAFAGSTSYTVHNAYVTMYSPGGGINRNVTLSFNNSHFAHHNDVRMLGQNGNVIWEEYGAVGYNGTREFWCGSDVYAIQTRVALANVLGIVTPLNAECNVSW